MGHRREEEILDRWADGETSRAIGERVGEHPSYIRAIVQRARDRGDSRATSRTVTPAMHHSTPKYVRQGVRDEAKARGMTAVELVNGLLEIIVRDKLFNAILDEDQ